MTEWFLCSVAWSIIGCPILPDRIWREGGLSDRPEAQRIHHRHRTRAHGEDVAQNAADAGGRALERLDERRVIVRLDLEGAGPAVADVDDAGVLARPLHHAAAARRQALQMHARRLVGAVLAPHHAEDAQLGELGSRPSDFRMRSYSSGEMPWSRSTSGVMVGSLARAGAFSTGVMARKELLLSHGGGKGGKAVRPAKFRLFFGFAPLIAAHQALPAAAEQRRLFGKWDGGRPQHDLARAGAGHIADFQRLAFRAAGDLFHLFCVVVLVCFERQPTRSDRARSRRALPARAPPGCREPAGGCRPAPYPYASSWHACSRRTRMPRSRRRRACLAPVWPRPGSGTSRW